MWLCHLPLELRSLSFGEPCPIASAGDGFSWPRCLWKIAMMGLGSFVSPLGSQLVELVIYLWSSWLPPCFYPNRKDHQGSVSWLRASEWMDVWDGHLLYDFRRSLLFQIDLEFAGDNSWCICANGTCMFSVFIWKFLWFYRFFPFLSSFGEVYWLIPSDPPRRGILITHAPGRRREVPDRNRYPTLG